MLTQHHLLSDAWSQGVLFTELFTLYGVAKMLVGLHQEGGEGDREVTAALQRVLLPAADFTDHLRYLADRDTVVAEKAWALNLADLGERHWWHRTRTPVRCLCRAASRPGSTTRYVTRSWRSQRSTA